MTDPNASPNQTNFQDSQDFEIDINKIYQTIIGYIDGKRSYVNVTGYSTTQLYNSITGSSDSTTVNNLVPSKTIQESRCHAFYRIIGFPVVSSGFQIYNPGHPKVVFATGTTLDLAAKIAIANDPIAGFNLLSLARENYALNAATTFTTPTTIDAGTLALSGGANPANLRDFNAPFIKSPSSNFDVDVTDQTYSVNLVGSVGGVSVPLTQYQDAAGNKPTSLSSLRTHIIRPFIVDPRIDFTVSPNTNLIGVPFVPDASYLQINASTKTFADPPLLETVIRDIYSVNNQLQNSGSFTQSLASFIKNISSTPVDETILGQINQNDISQLSQNSQFLQFLSLAQAMMKKLVDAQNIIYNAQSQYYWVPIPAINLGPEGSSSVQPVFLPNMISSTLVTPADGTIFVKTAQFVFSQSNQNPQASAPGNAIPDPGGLAVAVKCIFQSLGPNSTAGYTNNSSQTLDMLSAKRTTTLSQANDALRTIEIIMGEFSGLGLCDIIAIIAALYLMPPASLLGFLDPDALSRMNTQFNHTFTSPGIQQAMTDFTATLQQFYQLMGAVYQVTAATQGLSV